MKIQYIAIDGKVFEDEDKCLDYENQLIYDTEFKGCLFYDGGKTELVLSDVTIEQVWFMHFETIEQLKKFKELSERNEVTIVGLNDVNLVMGLNFYYDSTDDEFKQYDMETDNLIKRINKLQKEKNELFYSNF